MDTQTQIDRLIELAIVQRAELKALVEQLPQLREYLGTEIEKTFEQVEPQLRGELEEFCNKRTEEFVEALRGDVSEQVGEILKTLETAAAAKYSALMAERERNAELEKKAEHKIAEAAAALPSQVKEIVTAELARFPRAGEIDQLRKEFAEPRGLNPRGKWIAGETYNKLDLVTINGDSYVSNIDGNTEKPSRSAANWTLNAARGISGGGGGITSLNDILNAPTSGQIIGSENSQYVPKTLVAGTGITITDDPSTITIDASGAQEILTATVKNAESFAITRGQVVYLFGATGGFASVKLASNTSDATSAKTFGVVSDASIAANGTGTITCVGVQDKLMLGAYNDGDTLYLGATAGSVTNVKPYAPNHLVYVGIVERANNGNGELYVKIQNGYELDEIHDVQINAPKLAGQTLIYDATTDLWKNARLTAGVGVSITNADSSITISADGGVNYQGTWNASTNTPTLTSSVGTKGFYYVVSVAGSTNLNGVTDWKVGDWAIFNGTAWEKVDTTDQVSSVFGRTGAVVGVSTDYSAVGITNTAIGATNPSTGAFTTLSTTGNATIGTTSRLLLGGNENLGFRNNNDYSVIFTAGFADVLGFGLGYGAGSTRGGLIFRPSAGNDSSGIQIAGGGSASQSVGAYLSLEAINAGGSLAAGSAILGSANNGGSTNQKVILQTRATDRLTVASTGEIAVSSSTASSSTTTGALVVTGGVGVGGAINAGGNLTVSGNGAFGTEISANHANNPVFLLKEGGTSIASLQTFLGDLYIAISGATNKDIIFRRNSATETLRIAGSNGLVTTAGNLTVSGGTITGGASGMSLAAGGTNQNITLTPSGTGNISLSGPVQINGASTNANYRLAVKRATNFQLGVGLQNASSAISLEAFNDSVTANVPFAIYGNPLSLMGGSVLVGTFTNSSNGAIQLATHTTSAGGIGFGTDNQLFRYNAVQLALTNSSGTSGSAIASNMQLRVENGGNGGIQINVPDASTGGVYFGRAADAYYSGVERSGTNLQLRNNGTTALTLDSSQNATFAGFATVSKKTTTATQSSFVLGDDLAITTNSGRSKMTLGSTNSVSEILLGQTSSNCLVLQWEYAANVANARGLIGTYGYSNPIAVRASSITLETGGSATTALTITSAQQVQANATTASTSTTTGALVVSGGVGVAGAASIGGPILVGASSDVYISRVASGILDIRSASSPGTTSRLDLTGTTSAGIGFRQSGTRDWFISAESAELRVSCATAGSIFAVTSGNPVAVRDTTDSTSTSTGALTVAGGLGVAKAGWFGGNITISQAASTDAAIIANGGSGANAKLLLAPAGTNAVQILSQAAATYIDLTGTTTFRSGIGGATTATLTSGGNLTTAGSVTTAAPTSGTAKAWKLGEVATVSPTSPNRTIRVEIDGTVYYISAKTTND